MERFKVSLLSSSSAAEADLHSNMERFKACVALGCATGANIYIPIWRDLKPLPLAKVKIHDKIYIPIWRDLKAHSPVNSSLPEIIYIPIWRDLKYKRLLCLHERPQYLHSNMERFKAAHNSAQCISGNNIYIPIWRDLK